MAEPFVDIKLEGFEGLNKVLAAFSAKMREEVVRKAMRAGAYVVAAHAKRGIKAAGVFDTGSAEKGISVIALKTKPGNPNVTAKVGVRSGRAAHSKGKLRKGLVRDPFYWWYHELGTSKINARPFMAPAMQASSQQALTRIRTAAEKELERIYRREVK